MCMVEVVTFIFLDNHSAPAVEFLLQEFVVIAVFLHIEEFNISTELHMSMVLPCSTYSFGEGLVN